MFALINKVESMSTNLAGHMFQAFEQMTSHFTKLTGHHENAIFFKLLKCF